MRTLFLTTAAFAALVMVAPIGAAHAASSAELAAAVGGHLAHDQSADIFTLEGTLMAAQDICPAASIPDIDASIRRIEADPFAAVEEHKHPGQVRQWRAAGNHQFYTRSRGDNEVFACTDIERVVAGADKEVR